ncbi:glycosyltransferase [Candidatus Sumerlaeota bacterium]|nr:glycosyltransferase [Candidatus Sumerlaeota bacterium]
MNLTIVIPARNEQDNIPTTLSSIESRVKTPHFVIVVNDHSTDKTGDFVREFSKTHPNVRLFDNPGTGGFAHAVKAGFKQASPGAVVTVMADNCDQPETIDAMFAKILEGYDVVCGSRYMPGGKKLGGRFLQTFFSRFVGKSLRIISSLPTHDISNAFKMYRKEVVDSIEIEETGFAMSMELAVKARFRGFKVTEVPTIWKDRTAGSSHFRIFKVAYSYIRWYLRALRLSLKSRFMRILKKK